MVIQKGIAVILAVRSSIEDMAEVPDQPPDFQQNFLESM